MTNTLDRKIKSLVVELVESSPPSRPAESVLPRGETQPGMVPLRSGLARMTAVAMLVLAAGLAGALIGRHLDPAGDAPALSVVSGNPAPAPLFPTDEYGDEVRLLPTSLTPLVTDAASPLDGDDVPTLDGDVIAVGRIEGSDAEVFTWNTTGPLGLRGSCLQVVSSTGRDETCSQSAEPTTGETQAVWGVARVGVGVVAVWRVPEGASIVAAEAGETRLWQRPVGGIAAFVFDPDIPVVSMAALTADGELIGGTGLSPRQVAHPDATPETGVEGAEGDLVDLTDTNPAIRILAQGGTSREAFAEAADAQGLSFTCAAGGAPPGLGFDQWELCLVAADGVLAVVPFDGEPGLVARIRQQDLSGDVLVPLDSNQPVGIRYTQPPAAGVDIEYFGEAVGSMSAPTPTVPPPLPETFAEFLRAGLGTQQSRWGMTPGKFQEGDRSVIDVTFTDGRQIHLLYPADWPLDEYGWTPNTRVVYEPDQPRQDGGSVIAAQLIFTHGEDGEWSMDLHPMASWTEEELDLARSNITLHKQANGFVTVTTTRPFSHFTRDPGQTPLSPDFQHGAASVYTEILGLASEGGCVNDPQHYPLRESHRITWCDEDAGVIVAFLVPEEYHDEILDNFDLRLATTGPGG